MYDSDEDPERRRDKFARERRDDDRRGGSNNYSRYDNSQKRPPPRRDEYPSKRPREDGYEPSPRNGDETPVEESIYSGPLLTFKKFLLGQDDDITDEEALKKYNEYKAEHKKHQMERFFRSHKDEEWFRQKYNPEDVKKVREAQLANVNKRLEVFNELKESGQLDTFSLDYNNAEKVIRTMDALVVKLEGGSDEELKAVLTQKIEDESVAELKKEKTESSEEEKTATNDTEAEDGAIDEGNDKSSKVNIHKTCSVFLRNIPPSVTYEEIEALCKRSPGFLRLALSDGIAERKFYRRGWATFKRDVNIKEICWNLNSVRIRDTDLNGIINRDITRRIRTCNGISAHKTVAINDLKLAVKLVALYDKRLGLFNAADETPEDREKDIRMGVDLVAASTNPILKEIRHLVPDDALEEVSPEEAELLGIANSVPTNGNSDEKVKFERDEAILKALDLIVLYLRFVHSVDFYNHGHYSQEDAMPNRCGLLHVRGQPPSGAQFVNDESGNLVVPQKFIQDFIAGFNARIEKGLIEKEYVSEEEQEKLGKKDGAKEVEKFIEKNTVELAKDKWLCPLSGKKFKGPEFIRKHLQSKHEEKLEEVRVEADYFNNYIADAQRPMDVEPRLGPVARDVGSRDREYGRDREDDRNSTGGYGRDRAPPPSRHSAGGGGFGGGGRGGRYFDEQPRRDNRPQVSYRDLDAPEDIP
ncbi:unnamed protein product [Caenorhabditis bovis]|uniref:Serrate RNA effector molecule homolog n=1 Tax=Caenorhabditis bovis TaxID=2654633 RepID=A0A8S1F160_9PELO|nr:unnamed protein product [Caenorhabditis bovis]